MASLVKVPSLNLTNTNTNLPLSVNVTLESNTFSQISICGGIISTNDNYLTTSGMAQSQSLKFPSEIYYNYAKFLDKARASNTLRMFS